MSFCFDVWYRHRGSKKMPARIREAFHQGHDIVVRYRNKRQSVCMRPVMRCHSHYQDRLDAYAVYRVVPKLHPLEFKHWDAMDDWWQYIAVDPCNGAVFAYRSEPKLVDGFWNAVVDGFWNDDARHCKRLDGILKFDLTNVDKTVYIKRPQ